MTLVQCGTRRTSNTLDVELTLSLCRLWIQKMDSKNLEALTSALRSATDACRTCSTPRLGNGQSIRSPQRRPVKHSVMQCMTDVLALGRSILHLRHTMHLHISSVTASLPTEPVQLRKRAAGACRGSDLFAAISLPLYHLTCRNPSWITAKLQQDSTPDASSCRFPKPHFRDT